MKMKRLAFILILAILLSGCAREPVGRAVTGIQVEYQQPGSTISRTYTQTANIKHMLTYLRLLRPFGPVIPEGNYDFVCRITLKYSHGPDSVYLQQGSHYLRRDDGEWKSIDDTHGQLIYPMLLLLPSDTG